MYSNRSAMKLASLLCSFGLFLPFGSAFKAAVYEHVQQGNYADEPGIAVIEKNLAKYSEAARNASYQGADIIVFPETGILYLRNSLAHAEDIPEPGDVNPCVEQSLNNNTSWPILSNLSCLARDNSIYLVANIFDKKPCEVANNSDCSQSGWLYYNTNVAFDRNGTLVSRYHKNHLFGERRLVEPNPPEFAVFETDFGARVGMFICFDILFKEASDLVTQLGIDVAVVSSWWFDELPQGQSVSIQASWAIRHNVTLLASGIQNSSRGSLGSGIYRGWQGPLAYTYSPDDKDKLLVADVAQPVPDDPRYKDDLLEVADRVLLRDRTTEYSAVKLEETNGTETLCKGRFCCSLRYSTPAMNDAFFLLVNDGYKPTFVGVQLAVQECMVVRCEDIDGRPCGRFSYNSTTTFTQMELRAIFSVPDVFPMLVSDQLALTNGRHWRYNITPDYEAYLRIVERSPPPEPLLFAMLVGRIYENDIVPPRGRPLPPYF